MTDKEYMYRLDNQLTDIVLKLDIEDIKKVMKNTDLQSELDKGYNDYTLRMIFYNHIRNNHEYISILDYVDEINYLRSILERNK